MLVSQRTCFQPSVSVMDSSSESTGSDALEEGMNGDVNSHGLPLKLFAYISEVKKRSGVKLHVARGAHTTNSDVNNNHDTEDMDLFTRPRSKSGFTQVTSPLAQRRAVARPKSEYIPNGHYQIVDFNTATHHNGYHTDDDDIFHPLRVPEHHETIEHYRRASEPVCMDGLADNRNNNHLSSVSTNGSSDEDGGFEWGVNYDKAQSDIGTMELRHRSLEQGELLKKIEMLEKQNELLKQQLQSAKTSKDEGVQVQQYTKEPIQPIRLRQLAPLKFQQQLEDMEGIDSGVQIFHLFMDSERTYVNGLLTLVRQFFLPMKMFSACRPHVLPLLQLDGIFLNCEQLLLFHQSIFAAMSRIDQSTESHLISEFLNTFDKFLPGLTVYTPFLALGQQTFEEEYQSTVQNSEVSQLVAHCEENNGTILKDLFMSIFQHYDHYKQLLVLFLRLPESNDPRESQVINMIDYLKALSKELAGSVCDWNVMTAKMKVLQSITDSSMLPVEIFKSEVHYTKKGKLLHVVGTNEISCVCLLFTTHVALAHQTTDYRIEIVNPGMMALCGATLHERVDINGQPIQEDFITSDRQDQLGFKVIFHNKHSIYLRAKPNHLKDWLHHFNTAINSAHRNCSCKTRADSSTNTGINLGPQAKIAAASLEKLFQQLTNPLNNNREFLDTFFMTYCLFTTSEDVLTALINCLLQKSDVARNRYSDDWEVFSYHSSAAESDEEDAVKLINASPSMDTLESFNSGSVTTFLSEQDSPSNSVYNSPVMSRKTLSPSTSPRRCRKSDEGPGESSEDSKQPPESSDMFATARGTIKVKRRLSHDETGSGTTEQIVKAIKQRRSLTRAQSDSNIDEVISPTRRSRKLSTHSDSSTSSGLCQQVGAVERGTPPRAVISPSEEDVSSRPTRIDRQQTTESSSRSFSTSSGHFADQESEGEPLSPDPPCPTPRASIQMAVPIDEDTITTYNDNTSDDDKVQKDSIVSEMQEQFPLLRSSTSPLLSILAQNNDMCRSLPNNLHRIGLERSLSEEYPSPRSERSYTVSGANVTDLKASNSLVRRVADEGRILSEIYEDSAESRASTQSPSPPPFNDPRSRSDAFIGAGKPNITRLGANKSNSFDRKVNNAQQLEQARDLSRLKVVGENGRRGSILSRLLPSRKKRQSDPDVTPLSIQNALTQSLQHRPTSPMNVLSTSLPAHIKSSTPKSKSRFSMLRRRRDNNELMLSPTKDFSLSGGRLSPSPGARYGDPSSQLLQQRNIMLSIYANLNYWLSQHKEDFLYNKSLKDKLLSFLESHMEKVATCDRQQLELAEETLQKLQEVTSDDGVIDKSITNMLLRTIQPEFGLGALGWVEMTERPMSNSSIINLHHKQLARQLMLLEYALYTAIERRELVGCCWKRKNKEKEAPNVCRVIKHSNKLTSWVMTSILQQETVHGRAAAIELFIRVASDCLKHNDAQSSVLITCALNSCCVRHDRLKLSWEQVPSKFRQKYDKLVKFSNPDRHCRAMRSHLEKQQAPGVPYTGGYLEHIWAIENVQKTYTPEGLVNFSKMTALCSTIRSFLCFQSEPYEFEPDFKLMHYVMAAERLDDEELYHLSKEREP